MTWAWQTMDPLQRSWNMKSCLWKCQFGYTKLTATYWTSSYASKLFWRYLFESWLWLPLRTVVLPGFPQYLQENFKIVPQISPQLIPSTSFLIHDSLIILACNAILHEKLKAPLHKPQINKYINEGNLPHLYSNISQLRKLENIISYHKMPTQKKNICLHNERAKTYCAKITAYWIQIRWIIVIFSEEQGIQHTKPR